MALADGLYHHATTKRDLHLAKEVPKLPVSFLHDLNKHNVYSVIKLSTIRKSMLLLQMSMLVLILLPGYHSFQLDIFNDL